MHFVWESGSGVNLAFFESEIIIEDEPKLTHEQNMCKKIYQSTVFRDENGRYVIEIPFNNGTEKPDSGESPKLTIATQFQLEKRFLKYPNVESYRHKKPNQFSQLDKKLNQNSNFLCISICRYYFSFTINLLKTQG